MIVNKKKHEHYAWEKYLAAWSSEEQVYCLQQGDVVKAHLRNVAQDKYFYKLNPVSSHDLEWLSNQIQVPSAELRQNHDFLLEILAEQHPLRLEHAVGHELMGDCLPGTTDPAMPLSEQIHAVIESMSSRHLDALLDDNLKLIRSKKGLIEFVYHLATEYFRTRGNNGKLTVDISTHDAPENHVNCANLLPHLLAANLCHNLHQHAEKYRLLTVNNQSNIDFLTGDQPVINMLTAREYDHLYQGKLVLYYPISPRKAIILAEYPYFDGFDELNFDADAVKFYNRLIKENSHEEIYASSQEAFALPLA